MHWQLYPSNAYSISQINASSDSVCYGLDMAKGPWIDSIAKRRRDCKIKECPDDASQYCNGKIIISSELQAELGRTRAAKI
jgi:hypothetical protein